jgi:hypothetical protein
MSSSLPLQCPILHCLRSSRENLLNLLYDAALAVPFPLEPRQYLILVNCKAPTVLYVTFDYASDKHLARQSKRGMRVLLIHFYILW